MGAWGGEKKRKNSIGMRLWCALQKKREKKLKAIGGTFGGREWNIIAWGLCCLSLLKE